MNLGSSHNFISEEMVKKLQLPMDNQGDLQVKVANGDNMACVGKCNKLSVSLGSVDITTDFYILKLEDLDIVLRVYWLQTLRLIVWNFAKLTM